MTDFTIKPPSQEDVDTHASLDPYKVTPSGRFKATLGTAERMENDSQTWVAVGIPVTLVTTIDGEEAIGEVTVAGRGERTNVSTELFQRTQEDGEWIPTIGDDGEPVRRTDDGAQTAYSMGYKTLVQLMQSVGALASGDTDLSALGFLNGTGLLDADAIIAALSGYDGAEVGVQLRNQAQRRKDASGKRVAVRDAENKVRREAVITDFFAL
ncbi:hypothetical protein LCGC14_1113640 [marine sediment metagenome]|uniref:Uncharacterized protein n=1 Tax=marine sediment metagenome TaxID=412755 RepID=A0A0F9M617_9ZZZZ